jgi:hypothetical protein
MILRSGELNSFTAKVVGRIVPSMKFGLSLNWIDRSVLQGALKTCVWSLCTIPFPILGVCISPSSP